MGVPWGAPDDLNTFMAMVNNVPDDWTFSAFALGRNQMAYVAAAVLAGGNVRVGLEDNLWLDKGVLATNAQLVERARWHHRGHGRAGHRPAGGAREAGPDQAGAAMTMKAAIIGGGVIGGGWAARFLLNGWDVAVFDPDPEARAQDRRGAGTTRAAACRRSTTARCRRRARSASTTTWPRPSRAPTGCRKACPSGWTLKHAVLAEIMASRARRAVIGSSTSGFKPSELNANGRPRHRRASVQPGLPAAADRTGGRSRT